MPTWMIPSFWIVLCSATLKDQDKGCGGCAPARGSTPAPRPNLYQYGYTASFASTASFAMHEVDMTKSLILTLRNWWEEQPEKPSISIVHLIVGQFTCVEPASLQFAFEVQTQNTFLSGAKLHIQETPLVAFCHTCQEEYQPEIGIQYACPTCRSPMDDIRSGRELKIDRIEYTSPISTGGF